MDQTINQVLESIKQTNIELKENNIRLQKIAEKMGIFFDEQQEMKSDIRDFKKEMIALNKRLDTLLERFEDREQRIKVVK